MPHFIIGFDHEMQKTIPDVVADAIVRVVHAVRNHRSLVPATR
jgi:hypothetical protein